MPAGFASLVFSGSGDSCGSGDVLTPNGQKEANSQVPRVLQDQIVMPSAMTRIPVKTVTPIRFTWPERSSLTALVGTAC